VSTITTSFKPMPRWLLLAFRTLCIVIAAMFLIGAAARVSLAPSSLWTYVSILVTGGIVGWLLWVFWHLDRHDRKQQMFWAKAQEKKEPIQPPVPTRGNGP